MTTEEYSLRGKHVNVAMMTSGGLAPCLSSSIANLMKYWVQAYRSEEISGLSFRMYLGGYRGILTNDSIMVPETEWNEACIEALNGLGGSPIGNSRVKVRNNGASYAHPTVDVY
jgi:diphosphate-dependent phosphofructokinase